MPRIQEKVCTVEAHGFFPNSVGLSDGARQNERPAQTSSESLAQALQEGSRSCSATGGQEKGWGWSRGRWVQSSRQPFMQQRGVSAELCCSPRPLGLWRGWTAPCDAALFIQWGPCLLGSMQLCPSYQAGGSNCLAALHIKSYPLCSKRYTLDQQDSAAEISIVCRMNWTCWSQTTPGCRELHGQGKGIHFPVIFSF